MNLSKKERTQKDIIEVAKGIIHDKGHDAITVRYLAELTGHSYTNLYYYYKNVETLMWILRIEMIEDMIKELMFIVHKNDDPIQELLDALFTYINYFFRHPSVFRFFYFHAFAQQEGDDSYQQLENQFSSMWQTSFSRLIHEGYISSENVEVTAKTLIYAMHGLMLLFFSSNGITEEDTVKQELCKLVNHLLKKTCIGD